MLKLAFYKGGKSYFDRAVKLWTLSAYSHCEIVIDDVSFGAVPGLGTRYLVYPLMLPVNWDFIEIPVDKEAQGYIWSWCMTEMGCKYDWYGVFLSQVLGLSREDPNKWFCSEFCTQALRIGGLYKDLTPCQISPSDLARYVTKHPATSSS